MESGIARLIDRIQSGDADPQAILIYGSDAAQLSEFATQLVSFWIRGAIVDALDLERVVDAQKITSWGAGNQIRLSAIHDLGKYEEESEKFQGIPVVEFFRTQPLMAAHKVIWIDEAHLLNTRASNGLLKQLEELPSYAKMVLTTTNIGRILPTIRSRCLCVAAPFADWGSQPPPEPGMESTWSRNAGELTFLRDYPEPHSKLWELLQQVEIAPPMAAIKFSEATRKFAEELSKSSGLSIREAQSHLAELIAKWWLATRPSDPQVATVCSDLCRAITGYVNAGIGFDVLFGTILVHNRELYRNDSP